jgi:hypothetical protein
MYLLDALFYTNVVCSCGKYLFVVSGCAYIYKLSVETAEKVAQFFDGYLR